MPTVRELHNQAMELAESLFIALRRNEPITDLASRAFDLEREAARLVPASDHSEPTRSILYRSAAWLGIQAGRYAEAVECAEAGLAGVKHSDIRAELYDALAAALAGSMGDLRIDVAAGEWRV